MIRGFLVVVGLFTLLSACTQRVICPAYQSSFIYDQEAMRKKFSYFKEDSTPKILTASKSKYLIAVPESYRKKYRRLQTVEMTPIYPVIPDSLKPKDDDLSLAEQDETAPTDSTSTGDIQPGDSTYAITKTKEKYNLDQDLYMWYFRDMLVLPDVRAAMEKKSEKAKEPTDSTTSTTTGKKKGGLFKNPFKKTPKSDSTSQKKVTDVNAPPAKKKGLFGKTKEEPSKKDVPPKDKKKDDGFE